MLNKIKIASASFLLILLSSCSNWITPDVDTEWLTITDSEHFSIYTPSAWIDLTWDKEILPEIDWANIELVRSSNNAVSWYANNIVILWSELQTKRNSVDYTLLNFLQSARKYENITTLKSWNFVFNDWEQSSINISEIKYNSQTPAYKIIQTWRVCKENKAFFLTIGVNLDITDTTKYEDVLKTFTCKD